VSYEHLAESQEKKKGISCDWTRGRSHSPGDQDEQKKTFWCLSVELSTLENSSDAQSGRRAAI
jgi:hypothetical protein